MIRRPAPCRFVFDGQSLVNTPPYHATILGFGWPRLAIARTGLPGYIQLAVGGTSMTMLASTFATRAAKWIAPASFEPTIYVLCGGTTDYQAEGDAGAQVYADAGALAALARAAGAVYVVCTTTFPATVIVGGQETERQAGNALILADASGHFDAMIDFEVEGLDDPTDSRSYFDGVHIYGDLLHPDYGTGRAAVVARPVLEAAVAAVLP